jgi:Cupin superfamily protein
MIPGTTPAKTIRETQIKTTPIPEQPRTPRNLAELLAPDNQDQFLGQFWSTAFRLIPGVRGKYSGLLPWGALNRILEEHRLEPPRLRLMREGRPVPANSFIRYSKGNRARIPHLLSAELASELRCGATLVLDAVDELFEPLTKLAENLERVFHVRVQVNAYAGWRRFPGFDLHWDDHDVLVLQVAGRKHWKVYGIGRSFPMVRDIAPNVEPPRAPVWEGTLEDGDLLYIPRGWWHVALPLNEPTLHLTVGVHNPTGADLLEWFVERLRASEQVRRDLPRFEDVTTQAAYLERLLDVLIKSWDAKLLEEYFRHIDATSEPRTHLSLPWSATREVLPPDEANFSFRWAAARPTAVETGVNAVEIASNGKRWRFGLAARPLLEVITQGHPCTRDELHSFAHDQLSVQMIDCFLRELVLNGLLIVISDEADAEQATKKYPGGDFAPA